MACEESTSRRTYDDRRDRKAFFSQTMESSIVLSLSIIRKTSDIYVWRDRNRISGYIIAEHVLRSGRDYIGSQ